MAHKNYEAGLAEAVQKAERAYGAANAAVAGAGRIERINKAATDLIKAERAYSDCVCGRAYSGTPVER